MKLSDSFCDLAMLAVLAIDPILCLSGTDEIQIRVMEYGVRRL